MAIVTGAGRGLGAACAQALAAAGAHTILVSRTASEVQALAEQISAQGGSALAHAQDIAKPGSAREIAELAEREGDLRVLVNCAGTNRTGAARDYALADWDALFSINVRASFQMCQAVGGSLLDRGVPGSIVNMSSQMGSVGYPGRVAYCSSKHAVEGLTRALAVEWAQQGVRVNAVAPTFVETPLTRPMLAEPEFRAEALARIPTRRLATLEQVADAVRYLACPASGSVTGSVLRVDGGWTAW